MYKMFMLKSIQIFVISIVNSLRISPAGNILKKLSKINTVKP